MAAFKKDGFLAIVIESDASGLEGLRFKNERSIVWKRSTTVESIRFTTSDKLAELPAQARRDGGICGIRVSDLVSQMREKGHMLKQDLLKASVDNHGR